MTEKMTFKPIQELPEEEQTQMQALEKEVDKIEALRLRLAMLLKQARNEGILPKGLGLKKIMGKLIEWDEQGVLDEKVLDFDNYKKIDEKKGGEDKKDYLEEEFMGLLDECLQEVISRDGNYSDELAGSENSEKIGPIKEMLEYYKKLVQFGGNFNKMDLEKEDEELFSQTEKSVEEEKEQLKKLHRFRTKIFNRSVIRAEAYPLAIAKLENLIQKMKDDAKPISAILREEEKLKIGQSSFRKFVLSSPEAYAATALAELIEAKNVLDSGGNIVETPYVKAKMKRIMSILNDNRPVFIHGELGAGKTELAKLLARKELSKYHLARWEKKHGSCPPDPEGAKKWEADRSVQSEALIISGHRGIEIEQILGGISIKRGKVPSPDEQVKLINMELALYEETHKESPVLQTDLKILKKSIEDKFSRLEKGFGDNFSTEEKEEIEKAYSAAEAKVIANFKNRSEDQKYLDESLEIIKNAKKEAFKNPVETRVYLGPFYKAMKEGRPIIIDEINAIPHHVLIVLNDLLTRKYVPGSKSKNTIKPMVNDAETFEIKEGFAVIATGNWRPEDTDRYFGRQAIDAAFLSRFGLVNYDYLPNNIESDAETANVEAKRKYRQENELYRMMIVRLLDDDMQIEIPKLNSQHMDPLEQVEELAKMARAFQNVFSGREMDKKFFGSEHGGTATDADPRQILKENVLSLRHLVPILEQWKKDGFEKPLEDYIFMEYIIRSDSRPSEKAWLFDKFQKIGDFFQGERWKNWETMDFDRVFHKEFNPLSEESSSEETVEKKVFYSKRDIVDNLYGPLPKRNEYDAKMFEMNDAEFEELVEKLAEVISPFFNSEYRLKIFENAEDYKAFLKEANQYIKGFGSAEEIEKIEMAKRKKMLQEFIFLLYDVSQNEGKITKNKAEENASASELSQMINQIKDNSTKGINK